MRLISWNIQKGGGSRASEHVAAIAQKFEPDIVTFQEVRPKDGEARYRKELGRVGLCETKALFSAYGHGILVASRWPLDRLPAAAPFLIPAAETDFFRKPAAVVGEDVALHLLSCVVHRLEGAFELHVAHLPPGETRGWRKIDAFRGIFERLARPSELPRVLCGDFNEPWAETPSGPITWSNENRHARAAPQQWDDAVKSVLVGLADHDLVDVFRAAPGATVADEWSWVGRKRSGRYDHVFASRGLQVRTARYLHEVDDLRFREKPLSDHTPALVEFTG